MKEERKAWQSNYDQLNAENQQITNKSREIASQETLWQNKKRGYEGEIGRWSKEIDKHQKSLDNFKTLADVKQ